MYIRELDVGNADIARAVHKEVADGIDELHRRGTLKQHTQAVHIVIRIALARFGNEDTLDVELIVTDIEHLFNSANTFRHGCAHNGLLSSNAQSCTWDIDLIVTVGKTNRKKHLYTAILLPIGGIETRAGEVGFGLGRNGIRALEIGLVQL